MNNRDFEGSSSLNHWHDDHIVISSTPKQFSPMIRTSNVEIEKIDCVQDIQNMKTKIKEMVKSIDEMKNEMKSLNGNVTTLNESLQNFVKFYGRTQAIENIAYDVNFEAPNIPFKTIEELHDFNNKLMNKHFLEQMVRNLYYINLSEWD